MCEVCNAAGMVEPAATQMHGTLFVAIVGSVVGLGVVAAILLGGVGPFTSHVMAIGPVAEASVVVNVEVLNEGTREGRARCELTAYDANDIPVARTVTLSPAVPPRGLGSVRRPDSGIDRRPGPGHGPLPMTPIRWLLVAIGIVVFVVPRWPCRWSARSFRLPSRTFPRRWRTRRCTTWPRC